MRRTRFLNLICVTVLLIVPAVVFSAPLDDYYLARFATVYGSSATHPAMAVTGTEERCLTPLLHEVQRDWGALEPSTRKVVAKYLDRPTDTWTQQNLPVLKYQSPHFTIYYTTGSTPINSDAADPAWIPQVATVFEDVYAKEVKGALGYRPPPASSSDGRYAVYLADLAAANQFGYTQSEAPAPTTATPHAFTSFMVIDKAFTAAIYTQPKGDGSLSYTPLVSLRITAAHEFHHMIQYGYNFYFDTWYAEATSTWIEDEVYDDIPQLYSYLPPYFRSTMSSLHIPPNVSTGGGYGRWIFNRYLMERYGSTEIIRSFWEKLASVSPPSDGKDIPAVSVLAQAVTQWPQPGSLSEDFLGWCKRAYTRAWTSHMHEVTATNIPAVTYQGVSYPNGTAPLQVPGVNLPSLSFAYFLYLPSAGAPVDLVLKPGALPSGVVAVAMKKANGTFSEYTPDASGSITVPGFASSTETVLLLSNVGYSLAPVVNPPTGIAPAPETAATNTGGSGGGCFIATAAYGSPLHPKVMHLRQFRDRWLLTNPPGRVLVACYYRLSPPLARVIAERPELRSVARLALAPLVWSVEHLKAAGCGVVTALLLLIRVLSVRRRKVCSSVGEAERLMG